MSVFNISRFCRTLKWDFYHCRREKLNLFLILTTAFTLFFVMVLHGDQMQVTISGDVSAINFLSKRQYVAVLVVFAVAVGLYPLLHTKVGDPFAKDLQMRLNYLMLPATHLEKYVSRLLLSSLFHLLIFICAFVLADLLQYLYFLIMEPSNACLLMGQLYEMGKASETMTGVQVMEALIVASKYFVLLSFYVLVGFAIKRFAWVIGSVIILLLSTFFTISPASSIKLGLLALPESAELYLNAALIVCNLVASYYVFKRLQLHSSKLFNL